MGTSITIGAQFAEHSSGQLFPDIYLGTKDDYLVVNKSTFDFLNGGSLANTQFVIDTSIFYANQYASEAYSNSILYTNTISYNYAANAYSNAITFSANASNLSNGIVPSLRISGSYNGITEIGQLLTLSVGNSSVNTNINATSFTGTSNNSLNFNGELSSVYAKKYESPVFSNNASNGIVAFSNTGVGVYAQSNSNISVYGLSNTKPAIFGRADSNSAIYGISNTGYGVYGTSSSNYSGYFLGGLGLFATSITTSDIISHSTVNVGSNTKITPFSVTTPMVIVGNTLFHSTINTTSFTGTSNNTLYFDGQPPSYYMSGANTAYANAVEYAILVSNAAFYNAIEFANTVANNAYNNAVSYALSIAGTGADDAYSNAITFSANASNLSNGIVPNARLSGVYTSISQLFVQNNTNIAIQGKSANSQGIYGQSNTSYGVYGLSNTSAGILGQSTSSYGVFGTSETSYAVIGSSNTNVGVFGQSTSGWSGYFSGGLGVYVNTNLQVDGISTLSSLNFGSTVASDPQDLSKHISLWGGAYGFSVTGYTLNYNTDSTIGYHDFYNGGTLNFRVNTTATKAYSQFHTIGSYNYIKSSYYDDDDSGYIWQGSGRAINIAAGTYPASNGSLIAGTTNPVNINMGAGAINIAAYPSSTVGSVVATSQNLLHANTSNISWMGYNIWNTSNFNPSSYQANLASVGILELNSSDTGDRYSLIDFHSSDGVDYSFRIGRSPGVNGGAVIDQTGTGPLAMSAAGGFTMNGYGAWHAGNFDPTTKASLGSVVTFNDVTATRGDGTGVIFFGGPSYLYFDGTNYVMPGGDLYVNGSKAWTSATFDPASKPSTGNVVWVGLASNDLEQPYFTRLSDNVISWLATQNYVENRGSAWGQYWAATRAAINPATTNGETNFPVGTLLICMSDGSTTVRNATKTIYLSTGNTLQYTISTGGTALSGTWVCCGTLIGSGGFGNVYATLVQRIA